MTQTLGNLPAEQSTTYVAKGRRKLPKARREQPKGGKRGNRIPKQGTR